MGNLEIYLDKGRKESIIRQTDINLYVFPAINLNQPAAEARRAMRKIRTARRAFFSFFKGFILGRFFSGRP